MSALSWLLGRTPAPQNAIRAPSEPALIAETGANLTPITRQQNVKPPAHFVAARRLEAHNLTHIQDQTALKHPEITEKWRGIGGSLGLKHVNLPESARG
jgi:hypothetical protein